MLPALSLLILCTTSLSLLPSIAAYTSAFEITVKDAYLFRFPGAYPNGTNAGGNGIVKSGESQTFYSEQGGVPEFREFVLERGEEVYHCQFDGNIIEGIPLRERPVFTFKDGLLCQSAGGLGVSCEGVC